MDGIGSSLASASAMQQEMNSLAIQTAVMKKSQGVQKMIGEVIVGLIQEAGSTSSTAKSEGKAVGAGSNIDIFG